LYVRCTCSWTYASIAKSIGSTFYFDGRTSNVADSSVDFFEFKALFAFVDTGISLGGTFGYLILLDDVFKTSSLLGSKTDIVRFVPVFLILSPLIF